MGLLRRRLTAEKRPDYFRLTSTQDGSTLTLYKEEGATDHIIEYAVNGEAFSIYIPSTVLTLDEGDYVQWRKSKIDQTADFSGIIGDGSRKQWRFSATGNFIGSGDVKTLLKWNGKVDTLPSYCFLNLLSGGGGFGSVELNLEGINNIEEAACHTAKFTGQLVIPSSTTIINQLCFEKNRFSSVIIPVSLVGIRRYAFNDNTNLRAVYYQGTLDQWTNIVFGFGLQSIYGGEQPLVYAHNLYLKGVLFTGIYTFPEGRTEVGRFVFGGCTGLTGVILPETIQIIREYAFYNCTNLGGTLTISGSVTNIEKNAFYSTGISKLVIESHELYIAQDAFYDCHSLDDVIYKSTFNDWITKVSFFDMDATPCKFSHHLSCIDGVPENVVFSQGMAPTNWCLSGLQIKTLTINGDFGRTVQFAANNIMLTSISLGEGITAIGSYFASNCPALKNITFPSTITSMGIRIFTRSNLDWIKMLPTTPPTLGFQFAMYGNIGAIYVPYSPDHSVLNAYKTSVQWSNFSDKIHELDANGGIPI